MESNTGNEKSEGFDASRTIEKIRHFLPTQAPLKDFVHHNLLHAFQDEHFFTANFKATKIFGYKTYLAIDEYLYLFQRGLIDENILRGIWQKKHNNYADSYDLYKKLFENRIEFSFAGRIGQVIRLWKDYGHVNLSKYVQPLMFRILSSYLDQGIAIVSFPLDARLNFLENLASLENNSYTSFLFKRNGRVRDWLLKGSLPSIEQLLHMLVGNEQWFEDYLFDLQFEHPGWSGMVSVIEKSPDTLLHPRKISLKELIWFELLLQVDFLDQKLKKWKPLSEFAVFPEKHLFDLPVKSERFDVIEVWQEAMEWTYYEQVMKGLSESALEHHEDADRPSFQTIHCIDDRSESFRRYIEYLDPRAETYSWAGFFNLDFYYQPYYSHFKMKLAPASAQPRHIIYEKKSAAEPGADIYLETDTHSFWRAWFISQVLGLWTAIKLGLHLFRPKDSSHVIAAEKHSHQDSFLACEYEGEQENFSVGFPEDVIFDKVRKFFLSMGWTERFAPLVYVISHGAGSTNNPYYAAYDCGACSGKPGSVNARVLCYFLNKPGVRIRLKENGINIPDDTVFVPALHNTTTDKLTCYDKNIIPDTYLNLHREVKILLDKALTLNARERARRFVNVDYLQKNTKVNIREKVARRQFSLFEPRPEYNHATNAVCIVGRRRISKSLFLDRRAFLQSYDYRKDPQGIYLSYLLESLTVVCGGINLEYYYSRTDNEKLGAGSKLPHNVYGLIGVANGADGDLRFGLPSQMVEIHDPLRLMIIIEQYPEIVLKAISTSDRISGWFKNEWIRLSVMHPDTRNFYVFRQNTFDPYSFKGNFLVPRLKVEELLMLFEKVSDNMPVMLIS